MSIADPLAAGPPDCPLCPHPETEHGTYGCLHGWTWGSDDRLVAGCKCVRRRLIDYAAMTGLAP